MSTVALRGVGKQFEQLDVVAPLDLELDAGSFVSIVGPSGCGKSTLLRMIAGLEPASTGTITVAGLAPRLARQQQQIAVVPQQPGLLPWRSVAQNARLLLELGGGRRRDRSRHHDVDELLEIVGLTDFRDVHPHELSGGMQQRVALVRAMALGAPLVLMDEPFAALDELTRESMRQLVGRLVDGRDITVVLVTHSVGEAVALGDRVLVSSPRPMRVIADLPVPLTRPRADDVDTDPAFVETCARVRHALATGMGAST